MKTGFLFVLMPLIVHAQVIEEVDLDLAVDSSREIIAVEPTSGDSIYGRNKRGGFSPFLEISFGNIWSKYTDFPDEWWKYRMRLGGYGVCSGLSFYPC